MLQSAKILSLLNSHLVKHFKFCNIENESIQLFKTINECTANTIYTANNNRMPNYKKFERFFKKYVGITPYKYFKTKRFLNFYHNWWHNDQTKYINLVYENDYFDQNHLIKDFKAVLGQSPNKFKKMRNDYFTEHILASKLTSSEFKK